MLHVIIHLLLTGDGVGAAAKKKADRFIKAGGNITCAAEFVANNSKDGSIHYLLVPVADVLACRDLLNWFVTPRKVPGTMKVHNVMVDEPGVSILVRRLSCYEACCWDAPNARPVLPQRDCVFAPWGNWVRHILFTPAIYEKLKKDKKTYLKKKEELIAKANAEVRKIYLKLHIYYKKTYQKNIITCLNTCKCI